MAKSSNPDLITAIECFATALDLPAINKLINSIPEETYGTILLSNAMREEHKRLLRKRWEEGFIPLLDRKNLHDAKKFLKI